MYIIDLYLCQYAWQHMVEAYFSTKIKIIKNILKVYAMRNISDFVL